MIDRTKSVGVTYLLCTSLNDANMSSTELEPAKGLFECFRTAPFFMIVRIREHLRLIFT